ncbi:MAC/perforin domain-containing protein [Burkholderia stagnalis]|uniref:MAC/perforin domain-containing protein n=1 Tax=Burkholderia stagnalis TaxID=1503054 RepID=UPI0018C71493|nr:MAC/perforin domain-containing protein [Burkholderia stagnalis]
MNDRIKDAALAKPEARDVVGGINMLGCGLNALNWASSVVELNHVLDAKADEQTKTIDGIGYTIGARVEFTRDTTSTTEIHTFESSAEYHHKSSLKANAKGSYGMFSGGFDTTFSRQVSVLNEHYAAVYSQSERLWTLQVKNIESNLHRDFVSRVEALPKLAEDFGNIDKFVQFFKDFGTDVVTAVTVGGHLTYSILVDKSSVTKKDDLSASVSLGYGAFVANASTSISEEAKHQAKSQHAILKTSGGDVGIRFDYTQPSNCHAEFQNWRKNLSKAPRVVDVVLRPINEFVPQRCEEQAKALLRAREWYLENEATILADWEESYISVRNTSTQAAGPRLRASQGGTPALHVVIVGKDRKVRVDEKLDAPRRDAGSDAFDAFWQRAASLLAGVTDRHEMVLLATERWPRDSRYYPSSKMHAQLLAHGASMQTLERWRKLVQDMQPCGIAGMTYVLAGRGLLPEVTDFVVAGFGTPHQNNIRPTVRVSARFIAESAEKTHMLITNHREETNTKLHTIANVDGDKLALASGTQDKTRIEMVGGAPNDRRRHVPRAVLVSPSVVAALSGDHEFAHPDQFRNGRLPARDGSRSQRLPAVSVRRRRSPAAGRRDLGCAQQPGDAFPAGASFQPKPRPHPGRHFGGNQALARKLHGLDAAGARQLPVVRPATGDEPVHIISEARRCRASRHSSSSPGIFHGRVLSRPRAVHRRRRRLPARLRAVSLPLQQSGPMRAVRAAARHGDRARARRPAAGHGHAIHRHQLARKAHSNA